MTINIAKSQWGWTASLPNGVAVAHSKSRPLLEEYIRDSFGGAEGSSSGEDRGVVPGVPERGKDVSGMPAPGAPLTDVTYTTRARSTGATVSAGRTETGWGALCVSHGTTTSAPNRSRAETIVSRPQEWCPSCLDISAGLEPKIAKNALLEDLL